jgi:xanthine dehydrogenase YagS FAD-binding subunit
VEAYLRGRPASPETFDAASRLATEGARPLRDNAFKVALLQRTVLRALTNLAGAR